MKGSFRLKLLQAMGVEQKTPAKKEAQLRVKYENEKLEF